jgi:hypothetical protein
LTALFLLGCSVEDDFLPADQHDEMALYLAGIQAKVSDHWGDSGVLPARMEDLAGGTASVKTEDVWGRTLDTRFGVDRYCVRSAGPDRILSTPDDIGISGEVHEGVLKDSLWSGTPPSGVCLSA